jgi:leucyl-tRNA---protein transferase
MSLEFDFPVFLSPEELDELLGNGWFRMRENVFTTHYYIRDASLLSTVWLRSPLGNYRFSKSQRKHLRHLNARYDIRFMPLLITEEHEDLYQRYLTVAQGERSESLEGVLGDIECVVFKSQMLEVRDPQANNALVAMSVYDVGATSLQSIIGIYAPEYGHESLGVYTMLLEVEHAIVEGYQWYYIGYFTPGFSTFDYKLRLNNLQFFNPDTQQWFPIEQLDLSLLWSGQHISRLEEFQRYLEAHHMAPKIRLNVFYDTIILHDLGETYLDEPIFLDMRMQKNMRMGHLCYFSISQQVYRLYLVDYEARQGNSRHNNTEGRWPVHNSLIRKTHFVGEATTPEALMRDVWGT